MKKLIINADDFGLTPACDNAIAAAIRVGAVTSTSCLVWSRAPELPAVLRGRSGVHLRLTDGEPLMLPSVVQTLVDASGRFPRSQAAVAERGVNASEVWVEWNAQIEEFLHSGARPTHLDSHRHTHDLPGVREQYADLCVQYQCAGVPLSDRQRDELRALGVPTADYTEIRWTDGIEQTLQRLLEEDFARHDTVHLMTHPGVDDAGLRKCSTMTAVRARELKVLLAPETAAWLASHEIHVIPMEDLALPDPLEKVDILFLAWNRAEFTAESLAALGANTDWSRVRRLVIYTDGDRMREGYVARPPIPLDVIEYNTERHGGPVAIMNHFLTTSRPTPWFAKIDNDVVVPPGWLPACLAVLRDQPAVDLLGIEAIHEPVAGVSRVAEPCGHIGGIGLMRTACFSELPVPAGRLGFSDWQIKHDVKKAWLKPSLPVILLDRLPFEPWATLSREYEAEGWQRPWKRYSEEEHALWDWWRHK